MLRSSQEACTHPKRWPPPRPRACWGRGGGETGQNTSRSQQNVTAATARPSSSPASKKKSTWKTFFWKFSDLVPTGEEYIVCLNAHKRVGEHLRRIYSNSDFDSLTAVLGYLKRAFFPPTLIHFHSHTFIQSVAPYWLHKLLCFTSEIFCHKRALLSQRYHLLHRGDRSYSSAPYLQSKNFNNRYLKEKICPYKQGTLDLYPDRIWATMYVFTNTAFQGWDPALKFQSRKIISIPFFFRI